MFNVVWRIKIPKKVRLFIWQVLLDRVNTLDRQVTKRALLVGPFCCIMCQKTEEDLDHLLWDCQYTRDVWSYFFFQEFDVSFAAKGTSVLRLRSSFSIYLLERDPFLWFAGVCTMIWDLWGERNDRLFRGRNKNPYET